MKVRVNKCPNCSNKSFGGLGADGGSTKAALVSAELTDSGTYVINEEKMITVTPVICDECKYVMMFADL